MVRTRRPLALLLAMLALTAACANRAPLSEDQLAGLETTGGTFAAGEASGVESGGSAGSADGTTDVGGPGATGGGAGGGSGTAGAGGAAGATGKGGGGAAGPKNYDDGATDTKIVFGSVSSVSGLTDLLDPAAASAYFKFLNASRGGVNGRKLELLIYNDQFDTTRNAALTRQAVEKDRVFAFTASMAPLSGHGSKAYLEEKQIPVIGGELVNLQTWGISPMFYPQTILQSTDGGRLAGHFAVERVGCKRVAGLGSTTAEANAWTVNFEKGIKDKGQSGLVYFAQPTAAETDYNLYVAQMKSANADCITVGAGMPYFGRLRKAMAQQQYFPKLVMPSSAYDPAYVESTAGQPRENDYAFVQHDIFENAATNPAMKEFVDNVRKFESRAKLTGFALLAWVAAKTAAATIARMGDNLTRKNLLTTLDSTSAYNNGITPPITWRPGPHSATTCAKFIRMNADGTWRLLEDNYCL